MRRRALISSVVGSLTATALDVAVLAGAGVSAAAFYPSSLAAVAAMSGVIVAPLVGWWIGPQAASGEPSWVQNAVVALAGLSFAAWVGYALLLIAIAGAPGGPGTEVGFLAYAALYGLVATTVTVLLSIPLGAIWWLVVRLTG